MKTSRQFRSRLITAAVVIGLTSLSANTIAAKGGKPGGETLGNNLSVPAKFVPNTTGAPTLRIPCGTYAEPGGDGVSPSTVYDGYWLQKTAATWSADCLTAPTAEVIADWGDNLTNSEASLAAGRPIRVEVSLLDLSETTLKGFKITNLTPELADRLATYGTRNASTDGYTTNNPSVPAARVWDAGAKLNIQKLNSDGSVQATIFDGPMTAEINSGGSVVYGYNWGTKGKTNSPAVGTYKLTFSTSVATTIIGVADLTGNIPVFDDNSTSVTITLSGSTGGGGSGGAGNGNH
jgi:hypothetical protein